jgi:ABC-2 type transport system ATP-binding protein
MITAEGLTKCFGAFTAIEDVSFSVDHGEIIGFLGPNGAGKSTTMRILAGVFPPTSGTATIAGFDVVRQSLQARATIGYFPERVSLYLDMSVDRYLGYVAQMKGHSGGKARREAAAAVSSCGLEQVSHQVIGSLSKGFRQRVGIAQALVGSPAVLILDEPSSGLDPEQGAEMRALIRGLRGDRTVILSTHILPEIEATCDRVLIINKGRLLAVDTPANLNRQLRRTSQVHVEIVGAWETIAPALQAIPGVLRVERDLTAPQGTVTCTVTTEANRDLRETIAAAVSARGWGLRELRPVFLSLEDIFLSLVAQRDRAPADTTAP